MADKINLAELLDFAYKAQGMGGMNTSLYDVFRGINAMSHKPQLAANTDRRPILFMTKPTMNLSIPNVCNYRNLAHLADQSPMSVGNLIRCMLSSKGFGDPGDSARSAIIDDKNPFMPITNLITGMQAPPDVTISTHKTAEGMYGEHRVWADGHLGRNDSYDLTLTFQNVEGDVLGTLFLNWIEYMFRVKNGSMVPYISNQLQRIVDYEVRIYALILDRTSSFLQHIWAPNVAVPVGDSISGRFGFNITNHYNDENNVIQIPFTCTGNQIDDPILVFEFNQCVINCNPDMADPVRKQKMIKVEDKSTLFNTPLRAYFNFRMYPFIEYNNEFSWYIAKAEYDAFLAYEAKFIKGLDLSGKLNLNPLANFVKQSKVITT